MSLVLNEAGLASDAAFTVKEHFSTTPGLNSLPEVCMYTNYTMIVFYTFGGCVTISKKISTKLELSEAHTLHVLCTQSSALLYYIDYSL